MPKILIVNSHAADHEALRRELEAKDYQVIEAVGQAQALDRAWEERPDLVVLDSASQREESAALIAALRANPASVTLPVLLLTTSYQNQTASAYEGDPSIVYLTRPSTNQELLARIRTTLRESAVQDELRRRNDQLLALVRVMDAANSTLDLREMARRVLRRALVITSVAGGSIWLSNGEQLTCLAQLDADAPEQPPPDPQPLRPDTPLGRALTTRQPQFAEAPADDTPAAVLPLIASERTIGALLLTTRARQPVPPADRAVISALAAHVAVAIQHAQLYQAAERQRQQLQEIDRQKDEFISITSHELKNPMASIKGYADLMLRRVARQPSDPNRKALEIISQQVNRMTGLLDQLLDVSRIGTDRLQIDRRPADLAAIVGRIVEEMRSTSEQHRLMLEIRDAPLIGAFDEARIGQAVSNLLSNAIKYSPRGGLVSVRVARAPRGAAPEALLTVEDHGIGIPDKDQQRLFERFFRASNADATFPGMGLGLFITRGIVVRHGGRIWVRSQEGGGATFSIALPLDQS